MRTKLDRIALWIAVGPPFIVGSIVSLFEISDYLAINMNIPFFDIANSRWLPGVFYVGLFFSFSTPICWLLAGVLMLVPRLKKRLLRRTRNDNKKI